MKEGSWRSLSINDSVLFSLNSTASDNFRENHLILEFTTLWIGVSVSGVLLCMIFALIIMIQHDIIEKVSGGSPLGIEGAQSRLAVEVDGIGMETIIMMMIWSDRDN